LTESLLRDGPRFPWSLRGLPRFELSEGHLDRISLKVAVGTIKGASRARVPFDDSTNMCPLKRWSRRHRRCGRGTPPSGTPGSLGSPRSSRRVSSACVERLARDCGLHFGSPPLLPFRMVSTRSTQRRLNGGTVGHARKLEHPRVSVGCPYTGPIRSHRVRRGPPVTP
jgi:hypothetical protein